ncbi:MAG: gluconeogenesis factor YvcK family protein [Minisyncoccia bacterium]
MKKVVTIGGGTGSYSVLSGIKNLKDISLTALVTMADNGGSTGILRDELGVLPPGDIRQCLVALSEHSDIVRNLMTYRFEDGGLKGHNFGNIFLAALEKVTGDFAKGVEVASEILQIKGKVLPITNSTATLMMKLSDETVIVGENNINYANLTNLNVESLYYKEEVIINEQAREAIIEADYIILGPGNYYCSVLPNLIVEGFSQAILESKAKIILPINLVNKKRHILGWDVSSYVRGIEKYLSKKVDYILVNNELPSDEQMKKYGLFEGDGVLVRDDMEDDRVIRTSLLSKTIFTLNKKDRIGITRSYIRHDSTKMAFAIDKIIKDNSTKYIFDFDDVLLYSSSMLKGKIESTFNKKGILFDYSSSKNKSGHFILNDIIPDISERDQIYEEIMVNCSSFINEELVNIISGLGKENCYMVTFGNYEYQLEKIKRAGIENLFSEIIIVDIEDKKRAIEEICQKHKEQKVVFVDDKEKNLENLDLESYPNLKTILFDANGLENFKKEIQIT